MAKNGESPIIKKQRKLKRLQMNFPEAIAAIISGKKVTKLEWDTKKAYGYLKGGLLILHKDDGRDYKWIVSDGDMFGEDWVVIHE